MTDKLKFKLFFYSADKVLEPLARPSLQKKFSFRRELQAVRISFRLTVKKGQRFCCTSDFAAYRNRFSP